MMVVAVITGLLFSLAPALLAARTDAAKPGARTTTATKRQARLGQALVVVQVILALVLLSGAAMFLRTLHNLRTVESGFAREGVLTMQVDATVPRVRPSVAPSADDIRHEHARLGGMWEALALRILTIPNVMTAVAGTMAPLAGRDRGVHIAIGGGAVSRGGSIDSRQSCHRRLLRDHGHPRHDGTCFHACRSCRLAACGNSQ